MAGCRSSETRRTAFDGKAARPFRLTVSVYRADRNEFAVNVGQVPGEIGYSSLGHPRPAAADGRPSPATA